VQSEPVPAFACADGSLVLQTFVLDRTVLTLTDGSGELVRRIRQVRIDGSFHPAD
jgi:hypothetical protein